MLLAAEEAFHERLPHGTVLRLSGLYGGGSTRLLDMVREGRVEDPHRWTNRIHREDAADAVVHLLGMAIRPRNPLPRPDDEPAQLGDVAAYLAGRAGSRPPRPPTRPRGTGSGSPTRGSAATGWAVADPAIARGTPGSR